MMSSLKGSGSIFSASRSLRSSFSLSLVSYWSCLSDSEGLIHWDVQLQTQMTDTHWRCWPETRPSLRSSTSPPGTGAPSPSWPGRSPGSPGGSRPWSGAVLGSSWQDMTAWTCQMSLIARAIEDSRLWLERNTGTMSAPAAQTPGFLDNAHFIRFWIVTGINLIPATCSLEPDTMLQICGSGSE